MLATLDRRARLALGGALFLVLGAGTGWLWIQSREAAPGARPAMRLLPSFGRGVHAPDSVRIRVQVINATSVRGLARRATERLRDQGFDVVETGTTSEKRDSTLVLDRSGHPEWARLVAEAVGGARVESRPDSSRYLDVTLLLGATYRPPAEPLYP